VAQVAVCTPISKKTHKYGVGRAYSCWVLTTQRWCSV